MRTWQIVIATSAETLLLINTVLFLIYLIRGISIWKYFSMFLILSFLIEISSHITWSKNNPLAPVNNLFLLHILTLGEFLLLTLYYNQFFKKNSVWQKNVRPFMLIIAGLIIANTFFLQPIDKFNTNAKTLSQAIFITYSIGYYLLITNPKSGVFPKGMNIINSAILLYYAGSLFIFMFGNVFFQLDELHKIFWVANAFLYLVFQLLVFTAAIWQFRQTKSTYS